jgi:Tfp pilus assembly protein PilX
MTEKNKKNNRGFAAILVVIVLMCLILIVAFSLSAVLITKNRTSKNMILSAQSYYSAESGVEDGILRVAKNYNWTAINNFMLDNASINQNITQNGNVTTIETLSSYSNNFRKLTTSLTVNMTSIQFHYGVQVGEGGLEMNNGSKVDGSAGNVGNMYSNGPIKGYGSAEITGDAIVATGMSPDANNANHDKYGADKIFGRKNDSNNTDIAMKFMPATSGNLSQVAFYLKRSGSPGDGMIYLTEDNGSGSPKTTSLASAQFISSRIGEASYNWINYSFSSPYSVVANNIYWIVIDVSESNNTNKYFMIGQNAANTNISKSSVNWLSSPWATEGGSPVKNFAFKAWIGGVATYLENVDVGGNAYANTIIDSAITGEAHYQTIINSTAGSYHVETSDPAIETMPISDSNIADWKAIASAGDNLDSLCTASGTELNPIILNTGVMDCDFHPSGGSSIVLNGTIWIKKDIIFDTGTKMKLSDNYGTKSGVIIVDSDDPAKGKIDIGVNSPICGTQGYKTSPLGCYPSNNTYILMLSTHAGYADNAISISNNSNGAIYYAHNGLANVSNGANVKEVTAKKLQLNQNAVVTYESGLANTSFSNGPGAGWIVEEWKEIE